jgi:trk system potassium uptake protein TrkA
LTRAFIVGGRQIGILTAGVLESQGVSVTLFERDQERCDKVASILKKTVVVQGDGTDQATLEEANAQSGDAFLALTRDDEDNILASLVARKLGVKKVVALINRVAVADRILRFVRKGRVVSVTTFRQEEAEAIELMATPNSRYLGKPLRDIRFPRGAIVGAIARPDGTVIVPRGDIVIRERDQIIFFALERVIPELEASF